MKKIKVGSDFSGVGAFDQALKRLGINYETIFACDMDKYARQTFIHNYSLPKYYPENVYNREIPTEPLDIYMTSPPCQAFSLAGKRKGEDDKRGVLFYNSHEFIKKNNPRYFIFENVKGLLSDDNGKTFARWIDYLGGKSVNGNPVIFPHEESVPYHVYHKVLNAKNYGVPQNRERVYIIGIRDDADNNFLFPKEQPLIKSLKDVLEENVDEKYYLSEKMIKGFINKSGDFGNRFSPKNEKSITGNCITTIPGNRITDNFIQLGFINQDTQASKVYSENGLPTTQMLEINENDTSNCLTTVQKDNVVVEYKGIGVHPNSKKLEFDGFKYRPSPTLLATDYKAPKCIQYSDYRIRKLTPRECFRLMDFPDDFDFSVVSDSQAYKQAGNSIVVNVLTELIKKLHF